MKDKVLILKFGPVRSTPPAVYSIRELIKAGYDPIVLEYPYCSSPQETEFPTIRFAPKWLSVLPHKLSALTSVVAVIVYLGFTFVKKGRPKFIVTEDTLEQFIALVIKTLFRVPYVIHNHEVYKASEERGLIKLLLVSGIYGKTFHGASFVLFPDPHCLRLYRRYYRIQVPCLVVANCPPLRPPVQKKTLRERYGLKENKPVLVYLGGVGPHNCLEKAIEALAAVPDLYFLIAGTGAPAYLQSLQNLARQSGVENRVIFVPSVWGEEKWALLEGADISWCLYSPDLLRIRYASTGSNKLMESMAVGVAVVGGGNRYLARFIREKGVGIALTDPTLQRISDTLKDLAHSSQLRQRFGQQGRSLHETEFSYQAQFRKALDLFKALFP